MELLMLAAADFDAEITPPQSRAARALLGWTQQMLAEVAQVAIKTINSFERGDREPFRNNRRAIKAALERGGVAFVLGGVVRQHRIGKAKK